MDLSEDLHNAIGCALVAQNIRELRSLCEDPALLHNPWEIVPEIIQCINEQTEPGFLKGCSTVLTEVLEKCDSQDAVLILHKEISHTSDDTMFTHLLPPLKRVIEKIPPNRFQYAIWCFSAIQSFIDALPTPDSLNLEEKERVLMDSDSDVHRISRIYSSVCEFYEGVVGKFEPDTLALILMCLLGKPLVFLDLRVANGTKSRGRRVAERLAGLLISLSNPFKYLTWRKQVNTLGFSNLLYLIFSENVCIEWIPKVYDPVYVFQIGLRYVAELFNHDHQFVTEKGLILSESLINLVKGYTPLQHSLLDDTAHCKFCTGLTQVIVYSPLKPYRQKALGILKTYLTTFDDKGRYLLIYNVFNLTTHKGLSGYLITQYKDMLASEFTKPNLGEYFKGTKLSSFVRMFCHLEKNEESDLLELSEQIIPTLNLLRFLVIRDKNNLSGIADLIPELERIYLEPLKKGLIMSKGHYEFKIKEMEEGAAKGDMKDSDLRVSVKIGGSDLPDMTVVEKMRVLRSSMTAFDVMESLLCRLVEFIGHD